MSENCCRFAERCTCRRSSSAALLPFSETIATFDDIRRCVDALTDGTAEEEFLRVLQLHEQLSQQFALCKDDKKRLQNELDAALQNLSDLEGKLFHARRLLEIESKARREAEHLREVMAGKLLAIAELMQNERNLRDETRDQIATLSTLPRRRKSLMKHVGEKYGDINSTGSFLSDLSITQSEDDCLDVQTGNAWKKHRPSLPKNEMPCIGAKRSRKSNTGAATTPTTATTSARKSLTRRFSGNGLSNNGQRICATTKVSIPQSGDGIIQAESTVQTTPAVATPFKQATAPPMVPMSAGQCKKPVFVDSPAQQLRANMLRRHNFVNKTYIRTETCQPCQRKIRFGSIALRCRDCSLHCHVDCQSLLSIACVPQSNTPTMKGPLGYIKDYAPSVPPMIPALLVHCINEIEKRGLHVRHLYRESGNARDIKTLKDAFLRGKTMPNLSNIDVHVLCGTVKDFLRSLRETLIPSQLWKDFCNAVQDPEEKQVKPNLKKAIGALPQANRDTLAFLILHFQRMAAYPDVDMPLDDFARTFGATIVGFSMPSTENRMYAEVHMQYTVMTHLLNFETDYWLQFVDVQNTEWQTPKAINKEDYLLDATPNKSTIKKRKFFESPTFNQKLKK